MLTIELLLYPVMETILAFDTYVSIEVIEEAGEVSLCVCGLDKSNNNLTELTCQWHGRVVSPYRQTVEQFRSLPNSFSHFPLRYARVVLCENISYFIIKTVTHLTEGIQLNNGVPWITRAALNTTWCIYNWI